MLLKASRDICRDRLLAAKRKIVDCKMDAAPDKSHNKGKRRSREHQKNSFFWYNKFHIAGVLYCMFDITSAMGYNKIDIVVFCGKRQHGDERRRENGRII